MVDFIFRRWVDSFRKPQVRQRRSRRHRQQSLVAIESLESRIVLNATPMVIATGVSDIAVDENADSQVVDLSTLFSDPDQDPLVFTVQENTNSDLVAAEIVGDQLTLNFTADENGVAGITIYADDGLGGTVKKTVTVLVNNDGFATPTERDRPSNWERSFGQKTNIYLVIRDVDDPALTQTEIDDVRGREPVVREYFSKTSGGQIDMLPYAHVLDIPMELNDDDPDTEFDEARTRPSDYTKQANNYLQSQYGINYRDFFTVIYDVIKTKKNQNQGWAGINAGYKIVLQGPGLGVLIHEFGHRVGVGHAGRYNTAASGSHSTYVWDDLNSEYAVYDPSIHGHTATTYGARNVAYGNPYDVMGRSNSYGQFRVSKKVDRGWLTDQQVPDLNTLGEGTYRIYAHDALTNTVDANNLYGVSTPYQTDSLYGLTFNRQAEVFDSNTGQFEQVEQEVHLEYREGRSDLHVYLDGKLMDLNSNNTYGLNVGESVDDIDFGMSMFIAGTGNDFLSHNPPAPSDLATLRSQWFKFDVLSTGEDASGKYIEVQVSLQGGELPVADTPVSTIVVQENSVDSIVELSTAFTDADNDSLTYTVQETTGSSSVTATINGTLLTVSYAAGQTGSANIVVQADDGHGILVRKTYTISVVNSTGLVGAWAFDLDASDTSPHGSDNSGILKGDASIVNDAQRGKVLRLDGDGDYVAVADSNDINKTTVYERTISLAFNADSTSGRQILYEEGGTSKGMSIYIDNGTLYTGIWNGNKQSFLNLGTIAAGEWNTVALVFDGNNQTVTGYLNANMVSTQGTSFSSVPSHKDNIAIGRNSKKTLFHDGISGNTSYFAGLLDDVFVYNRVLSPDEIL